jgi:hypothetical protein
VSVVPDQVLVEHSLDTIDAFWAETFDGPCPRDQLRGGVTRHYAMRPPRRYSRDVAGAAACFVILRLTGHSATSAEIHTCHHDWRGVARSVDTRNSNPVRLIYRARAILAEVLAGELLDDASPSKRAADNIERLLHARFILARSAELSGRKKSLLWRHTLTDAGRYVEFYGDEIRDLAALARHELKPRVRAILRRVDAKLFEFSPVSQRCENAFADIDAALHEFSEFSK